MDNETKGLIQLIVTGIFGILAGGGIWNYLGEWIKRKMPTHSEIVEDDIKTSKMALDIAASLRLDLERLQKEVARIDDERDEEKMNCRNEIEEIKATYLRHIEELRQGYEKQIMEIRAEYENKLQAYKVAADQQMEVLRGKIVVLEEEREELLALKKVIDSNH